MEEEKENNLKISSGKEEIKTDDKEQEEQEKSKVQKSSSDFSFWILLFNIAIIKDCIDFFDNVLATTVNVIPLLGQAASVILHCFSMVFSWILGALIFFLLFFKGKSRTFKKVRQLIVQGGGTVLDSIPLISFLPLTLLSLLIIFFIEKTSEKSKIGKMFSSLKDKKIFSFLNLSSLKL
jgi:ABC-type anion transport system duplicated permease subunit